MRSIVEARQELDRHLTPTLHNAAQEAFPSFYRDARKLAELGLREHGEHAAADALPQISPYTLEQVLAKDWYPALPK